MRMKIFALIAATFLIATQAQRPTQLPLPDGCEIPCIDGVFVLDVSNSIPNETAFQLMKDFVAATFPLVNISANCSRAGLILFASDARIEFNLNEYTDEASLRDALDSVTLRGVRANRFRQGTNTPAALDLLRTAAEDGRLGLSNDRQRIVRIAVFITDGRPSLNHIRPTRPEEADQLTEQAGNRLHSSGAYDEIYAIGIQGGRGEIRDTLRFIADPPDRIFSIESFSQELFVEAAVNISIQFCDPCLLSPCPPGSICRTCNGTRETYCEFTCTVDNGGCGAGSRCVEVDVPTCSPGQCCSPVSITCQTCNLSIPIDCVYVLDVSVSIENDTNFGFMRDLVIQSAQQLVIGENNVLFSLILFARQANIIFDISQHTNIADLIRAISQISYYDTPELSRTGTNIPEALDLLREAGQDGRLRLRPDAVYRHVVFITDGRPNTISLTEERIGRRLRGRERQEQLDRDASNSVIAARRLHESGIYNDTVAIGIRGQRGVDIVELDSIASRPDLRFEIQSFTTEAFQAVIRRLSEEFCDPCTQFSCPRGSECKVCEETGMPYCEFSCLIDNGGCPPDVTCEETSTCVPGECCSPTITCVEGCPIPCIDGVFVLDVSNSIPSEEDFQLMKNFVARTFPLVNISASCSRAGLILFASDARIEFNLNEYTDEASLQNALDNVTLRGVSANRFRRGTNTPAALNLMRTAAQDGSLGLRDDRVQVAVVITDGRPSLRHIGIPREQDADERTEHAGNILRDANIYEQIYAIGIEGGRGEIRDTLRFIADPPELTFLIANFSEELFNEAAENTSRQFCNPCILTQCPRGSVCRICSGTRRAYCEYTCAVDNGGCDEGSQCIEVDIPTCSPGQCCSPVNTTCRTCDVGKVDVVYVLDVSLSIENDVNFGLMRDIAIQSAQQLVIGVDDVLFSLILFARQANIIFNISQYTNRADLIEAIRDVSYFDTPELNRTGTNIPEALDLVREAGQDGRLRLRPDTTFKNVIFITDGRPNTIQLTEERNGTRIRGQRARDRQLAVDEANTIEAARKLHESRIYNDVFAIGIRGEQDINIIELDHIASRPEFRFDIQDFTAEAFQDVIQQLSGEICTNCTGFECPRGSVCRVCEETGRPYCEFSCLIDNGGCPLDARCVSTSISCPPGQCCSPNVTCDEACEVGKIDCVVVVDNSVSIGNNLNFGQMRNLITRIARLLDIGVDDALFSVITFARQAWINFPISEHTTRDDLIDAVNEISYFDKPQLNRTGTNIPEALNLLREAGQDGRLGLRPDAVYTHAIFITDGRPNTISLTEEQLGNRLSRQERREQLNRDSENSIEAARRLHESGIYDDVIAIGIRAEAEINFGELDHIASSPDLRFEIQGFTAQAFEAVIQQITDEVCDACVGFTCPSGSTCRVCEETGEAYCEYSCDMDNGGCSADTTCTETPITCPPGQCCSSVNITCEVCPPQCSHDYCNSPFVRNSDTLIPCMRGPPPYTEANCTDDCQLTYCQACYYSPGLLPSPPGCSRYRYVSKGCLCCLREWARCVERLDRRDNECTGRDCQTPDNFRCYEYPLCI